MSWNQNFFVKDAIAGSLRLNLPSWQLYFAIQLETQMYQYATLHQYVTENAMCNFTLRSRSHCHFGFSGGWICGMHLWKPSFILACIFNIFICSTNYFLNFGMFALCKQNKGRSEDTAQAPLPSFHLHFANMFILNRQLVQAIIVS